MISVNSQEIVNYCCSKSTVPAETCQKLEKYTRENVEMSQMLVGPLEASFLGFLIRLNKARRVLEIGTFTGYSALAMAEQMPEGGELITLDICEETTKVAKEYWAQSKHGVKIRSMIGPAQQALLQLQGPIDLVFIDADKQGYLSYLKASLEMLSENGVVVLDNCLWSGKVIDEKEIDTSTVALREVTDWVKAQTNLYSTLLPVRDGILLVQKKTY